MQNITSLEELRNGIEFLEAEQAVKAQVLKEQFFLTYESLKPINLLRSSMKEMVSSPDLIDDLLGTVTGLLTGFLSKKILVGKSGNLIRKLIGSIMQFGVTNVVSQHPDIIKSIGKFIVSLLFRKKESESEIT